MSVRVPSLVYSGLIAGVLLTAPACAHRQYERGNDAMEDGKVSTAIKHYQKAVKRKPNEAEYQLALGSAYVRASAWSKAVEALQAADKLDGENADVLEQLGFALVKSGDLKGASDVYQRLFKLRKFPLSVFEKLRPVLEEQERYGEVVDAMLLVSRQPRFDVRIITDLAREYHRQRRLKEAERLYARLAELTPRQASVWRTLGELRLALNDSKGATEAFEQAFAIDPNDVGTALGAAHALRRLGQTSKAMRLYEKVVAADSERSDARAPLVELYIATGQLDEAEANAREVFIRAPDDPAGLALRGAVYCARGDYPKAVSFLQRAENSDFPWVGRMLGDSYYGMGETASARASYVRALSRNPEDGAAHLGLCRLDLAVKKEQQGMERCRKAMTYAPELQDQVLEVMTSYFEEQGRVGKAEEVVEKAPAQAESHVKAGVASQKAAARVTRKTAISDVKSRRDALLGMDEADRSAKDWYELGDLSWTLDDLETAEKAFKKAWQLEERNESYHLRLALTLLARQNYDSAVVHLKDIVRKDERDVKARFGLAEAYLARGSASDAVEVLKELRELAPGNPKVYQMLADAYLELGMEDEAQKAQAQAVEARKKK